MPAYEINSQTVDILYTMATRSERRAALAKIALEDIEEQTQEYLAESKYISKPYQTRTIIAIWFLYLPVGY